MRFQKMFRFSLGSRILAIKVNAWNEHLSTYTGVTNETSDGFFVPFFDFVENCTVNDIINTLREIQEEYGISDIHIIQTHPQPSYRAVGFDKMEWREYCAMLCSTDYIDWSYVKHSIMRGRAVVRITDKPSTENKLVHTIRNNSFLRKRSADHLFFFSWLFKLPLPDDYFPSVRMMKPPKKLNLRLSKYESFR